MHRIRSRPSTPAALTGRWDDGARPATPAGGLPGAAVARPRAALDGGLVVSSVVLCALGVVMIYSTTAPLAIGSAIPPHYVRHLVGLRARLRRAAAGALGAAALVAARGLRAVGDQRRAVVATVAVSARRPRR